MMLVLSRKQGETIHVGDHVIIQVVRIGPNSVRIGVKAPSEMNIVRSELLTESAEQGRRQDAGRMDDGHGRPHFDNDPLLIGGMYGP